MKRFLLFFLWGCGCLIACKNEQTPPEADDVLLATVHGKPLYLSEVNSMVPAESNPKDSAMISSAFMEKWIREELLMNEAERNLPKDLKIDDLVRDYRASLIRHNYEKILVEIQLDSTITSQELLNYYETNKEQFRLKEPIVRCLFMEMPKNSTDLKEADQLWKNYDKAGGAEALKSFAAAQSSQFIMNDSTWYQPNYLMALIPEEKRKSKNFTNGTKITFQDDQFKYYLSIRDRTPKGEIAPMEYVIDQISRVILHQRKIALLDEKREEIYEREINRNTIKVYN